MILTTELIGFPIGMLFPYVQWNFVRILAFMLLIMVQRFVDFEQLRILYMLQELSNRLY